MLDANRINLLQVPPSLSPSYPSSPTPTPVTPAWVPWAIGAAVGGGILYLLLRD